VKGKLRIKGQISIDKILHSNQTCLWVQKAWTFYCFLVLGLAQARWFGLKGLLGILIMDVVCLVGLFAVLELETGQKKVILVVGIVAAFICGLLLNYILRLGILSYISKSFRWFMNYFSTREGYHKGYGVVVLSFIVLVEFIVIWCIKKIPYGKEVLCILGLAGIVVAGFFQCTLSFWLIGTVFLYFIYVFSNRLHVLVYHNKANKNAIFYLIPFFLLCIILTKALPVKKEPISWTWAVKAYQTVVYGVEDFVDNVKAKFTERGSTFSFGDVYSNDDKSVKLGGTVDPTDKVLLKVNKSIVSKSSTYLYGSVLDEYTGSGWKKNAVSKKEMYSEINLSLEETLFGLYHSDYSLEEGEVLVQYPFLGICFGRMRSRTLFYPQNLSVVKLNNQKERYDNETANLLFQKAKKKGYRYEVHYLEMNMQSAKIQNYLRSLDGFSYQTEVAGNVNGEVFGAACNLVRMEPSFINKDFYYHMYERQKGINENYTKLPNTIPQRVYDLAKDLTKDANNQYDKLMCIQQYLKTLKYSKKVDKVPKDTEFTDHFLFDTKKGYCTYFATAMAVLGRCLDIPTRYCEGFIVEHEKNKVEGEYQVSGESAHAWCEAYFAGFGWVRFEATPGYGSSKVVSWKSEKYENHNYDFAADDEEPEPSELPDEKNENIMKQQTKSILSGIIVVVILIVVIIVLVITFGVIRYENMKRKVKDNRQIVNQVFAEILYYLKLFGYEREEGETILQLKRKIPQGEGSMFGSYLNNWDVFLKARYSYGDISDEERNRLIGELEGIKKIYLEEKGKFTYVISRISVMIALGNRE